MQSRFLICGLCCLLLSACEPLPVTVTVKAAPGATAEAAGDASSDAAPAGYGNFTGTVTWSGDIPAARPALVAKGDASAKDAAVCAAMDVPDETLVINSGNKGIANVIVVLARAPKAVKPELARPPSEPMIFDQKGCRFLPHVLLVRVGQPLLVKSDDAVPHNTHTYPSRNNSLNSSVAPNDRQGIACNYTKPEGTPVEVKCDLHSWMKAYHFPVDHPYAAVTDANGKFRIEGLPAGKHTFKVWQERGQFIEAKLVVEIKTDEDTTLDLSYGSNKIAAAPPVSADTLTIARLQRGGDLSLERKDER